MELFWKIATQENLLFMLRATGLAFILAVASLILGTALGVAGAAGRISRNKLVYKIATAYVELIRGTPLLVQILFIFLAVPTIIRAIIGTPLNFNPITIGITAMSVNTGAYTTELIRAAIQSVDKGQWEAGKTLGMPYNKIMKFIILPQAFKRIVPPLVNEFVGLIKNSSLLSSIGMVELTQSARIIGARYYNYFIPLSIASLIYLVLTLIISTLAKRLERRLAAND
jgi:polar amino acid transport system permease protein